MLTQNICGKKCGTFEVAQNLVLFLYEWFCGDMKLFFFDDSTDRKEYANSFLLFPPPLSLKNKILSFSKVPHFFRATC
jgi:hypothetical protein